MSQMRDLNISTVMRCLLFTLIFFQPFNHFNSFREISFYGLSALFLLKLVKGDIKNIILKDATIITLFLILGWSVAVSVFGPYPEESLNAVRKNLLKHVVVFFVILSEFNSFRDMKPLLWVVVSSFAFVTVASITENAVKDWDSFVSLSPSTMWRATSTYFFANYSDNSTFYLPFTAAWFLSAKEASWKKWIGALTLTAGLALVYIYNARTHLLAVLISFFVILILARKYRMVAVFVIAAVLSISIITTTKYEGLSRYKTLLNPDTYVTDSGLTNRLGLWQVVIDFIRERPATGYGYGWKKLAWLVQEKDSEEFWEGLPASAYDYYVVDAQLMYGRVSPHNLPLQIAFEIGLAGLAMYLLLWYTIAGKISGIAKADRNIESRALTISSIGVIVSFACVNITNSLWQENYGMMIFLYMAVIAVIHRELSSGNPLTMQRNEGTIKKQS